MGKPTTSTVFWWFMIIAVASSKKETGPRTYTLGEKVPLNVNSLTSTKTPYPIDYYRFPHCQPAGGSRMEDEFFGEFVAGDRIQSSPYELRMKEEVYCRQLCISNVGRGEQRGMIPNKVVKAIRKEYNNNWILDGLTSASKSEDDSSITTRYWEGFPMGFIAHDNRLAYLNNHVNIEIMYHQLDDGSFEIVRFTVEPFSIRHDWRPVVEPDDENFDAVAKIENPISSCTPDHLESHTNYEMVTAVGRAPQIASGLILFTYDVRWSENVDLAWSNRWDVYLTMDGAITQYTLDSWLLWSIAMVVGLATFLAVRVTKILNRQQRYQSLLGAGADVGQEEGYHQASGIAALHGEIFRPPESAPRIFALLMGAGAQLLATLLLLALLANRNYLNPEHIRASVIQIGIVAFGLMGFVGGFVTAWVSKTFRGEVHHDWSTLAGSMWFPISFFGIYELNNLISLYVGSSAGVQFIILQIYIFFWLLVATPVAMAGAYLGFQQKPIWFPYQPRALRRQIPSPQPILLKLPLTFALTGILPFGFFYPDYYYLMSAFWLGYYDTHYTWSLAVFVLSLCMCAIISILWMIYQFQKENHHWWWRAYCLGGSPVLYLLVWTCWSNGYDDKSSTFEYILYTLIICWMFFLMMGFVSVTACLIFNVFFFQRLFPANNDEDEEDGGYLMIDDPHGDRNGGVGGLLFQEIASEADVGAAAATAS